MTDWIPTVIAVAAFAFSLVNWHVSRQHDKRDLFLAMHERLIASEVQEGRRLLYLDHSLDQLDELRKSGSPEYQLINRALANFDVLAMYVDRGYIDRNVVLEEWGHSLARAYQRAEPFISNRVANQSWRPWPHLRAFGPTAVEWHEQNRS